MGKGQLLSIIKLLTEHPAKFLHIDNRKGILKVGLDADFVVWNPDESFEVTTKSIFHKHHLSPYNGKQLVGKVLQTIVNGITVFENDSIKELNAGKMIFSKNTKKYIDKTDQLKKSKIIPNPLNP